MTLLLQRGMDYYLTSLIGFTRFSADLNLVLKERMSQELPFPLRGRGHAIGRIQCSRCWSAQAKYKAFRSNLPHYQQSLPMKLLIRIVACLFVLSFFEGCTGKGESPNGASTTP